MTIETFEKAKELEKRIEHISSLIDVIGDHAYTLDPPTRHTSVYLTGIEASTFELNEGEVVFIREALEKELSNLNREFGNL